MFLIRTGGFLIRKMSFAKQCDHERPNQVFPMHLMEDAGLVRDVFEMWLFEEQEIFLELTKSTFIHL